MAACSAVIALAGCGVGEDGGPGTKPAPAPDAGPFMPDPIDPNPNRIVCTAAFKVTGTFTASDPRRPDPDEPGYAEGCWPVGTWTFSASIDTTAEVLDITGDGKGDRCGEMSGTSAPSLADSYSFQYARVAETNGGQFDGWKDTITVTDGVAEANVLRMKVSEGGGGECEGGLLFNDDARTSEWNLHPVKVGTTLEGFGEFTLYIDPQVNGGSGST